MAAGAGRGFTAAVAFVPAGFLLERAVASAAAGGAEQGGKQQPSG